MAEVSEGRVPLRARAIGVHLGVVGLSFVLSFMLLPLISTFDPEGGLILVTLVMLLLGHAAALVVGLLLPRANLRSSAIVFCMAFFFTGCFGIEQIQRWRHLKFEAPYDRFRDHLASPVPESVSGLHFPTLEETVEPELFLRFEIAPADMDAILGRLRLKRVVAGGLLNPDDLFRHGYYLPIEGGYELFQGTGRYDEILTIKIDRSHSHAVFRHESSNKYRYKSTNEVLARMRSEALEKLRRKYDSAHGSGAGRR